MMNWYIWVEKNIQNHLCLTKTTALTIVALCRYEENPDDAIEMLNFLKGPENPRPIKFRKKPSTGQWFLNDIQCLDDIRVPVSEDPWAQIYNKKNREW